LELRKLWDRAGFHDQKVVEDLHPLVELKEENPVRPKLGVRRSTS